MLSSGLRSLFRNQTALKSEWCGRDSPEDAVTLWHIDESSTAGSWNDADPSQARAFVYEMFLRSVALHS